MFIDIIILPPAVFRIICGQSRSCQKYFGGTENSSKKRYTSFRIKMQEHILSNINSVLHHNGSKIECESTIVTSYFNIPSKHTHGNNEFQKNKIINSTKNESSILEEYLKTLPNMLSLHDCMVIFTPEETIKYDAF